MDALDAYDPALLAALGLTYRDATRDLAAVARMPVTPETAARFREVQATRDALAVEAVEEVARLPVRRFLRVVQGGRRA